MIKGKKPSVLNGLTDEQILKEIVKYLNVDGAAIVYIDKGEERGLTRWKNKNGKKWTEFLMSKLNYIRLSKGIKITPISKS